MATELSETKFLYNSISQTIKNEYLDVRQLEFGSKLNYIWSFFSVDEDSHINNKNAISFDITIEKMSPDKQFYKYSIKHVNEENHYEDKYLFLHYILDERSEIEKNNIEEEISQKLRKSKSFVINNSNSYVNEHFLFTVSEKGIALCSYDKDVKYGLNRHSRFLTLYLLAIAYNIKIEQFLEEGAQIYKIYRQKKDDKDANGIKDIIDFRESIYAFDLQYFFENPVKIDRYEAYIVWEVIAECYKVKHRHDEIKAQVLSLTEIIVKNKDQVIQEYEKEQQHKVEKAKQMEKSFQNRISLIGLLVAIVPIMIELIESYAGLRTYKNIILLSILLGFVVIFFGMFINSKIKEKRIKDI